MLRLSNLSIGTRLIITSTLGILLMAGMITTVMIGNTTVQGAVGDTTTQASVSQAAAGARGALRGMEIGLRDMRLSLSLDASQKAMDNFHERQKSGNGFIDFLLKYENEKENKDRMAKVKTLADKYAAEIEKIAAMNAEIFSLQGQRMGATT